MKLKAITVIFGALVASSLSFPTEFGSPADAADAVAPPRPPQQQAVKIPEFVPIVNFGEFVMAMQTFAAQNPPEARVAAEAMSAKFASDVEAQKIEVHKASPQVATAEAKPAPAIVTRPVVVAEIPAVPDPAAAPPAVPDPVKIVTGYPVNRGLHSARHHKAEKKIAATSRARAEKRFEPAMGLGMVIDSAEEAPPISTLGQKKRKVKAGSQDSE